MRVEKQGVSLDSSDDSSKKQRGRWQLPYGAGGLAAISGEDGGLHEGGHSGDPAIKHLFDIWHVGKGIKKKLQTLSPKRDYQDPIKPWVGSIVNHLYWAVISTPAGNGQLIADKWKSVLEHIHNRHNGFDGLFPQCTHGPLEGQETQKPWLKSCDMATAMISENGRSGVSSLFPPRRNEDSLHDYVRILVQRSKSNFFKDIDDDQLSRLPDHVRPRVQSVRVRGTKLVFAYESQKDWGAVFRDNLKPKAEGGYGALQATYKEAERLWREHSQTYQSCRSVARQGKLPGGRLNIHRTRRPEDTEAEYRRRMRQEVTASEVRKEATAVEERAVNRAAQNERIDASIILWHELRPVVHELIRKLSKRGAMSHHGTRWLLWATSSSSRFSVASLTQTTTTKRPAEYHMYPGPL
ncbi:hypothetical protein Bbelb_242950 [Branchiostoma belcheri]|nr:hypothetical protein Bbelb_242950 [Branchiostoma belcheri]